MFWFSSEKMLWYFKKFYPDKGLKYAVLLFDSVKGRQEFFDLVNQWKINHTLPYLLAMILKAANNA